MTRPLVIAALVALHGPIAVRVREFPLSLISLHFDAVTNRRARLSLRPYHDQYQHEKTTQKPRY